jgi:hypothetical protein
MSGVDKINDMQRDLSAARPYKQWMRLKEHPKIAELRVTSRVGRWLLSVYSLVLPLTTSVLSSLSMVKTNAYPGHRQPLIAVGVPTGAIGQVNILSAYKFGEPGKTPARNEIRYRIPCNVRVIRKCRDTGQMAQAIRSLRSAQEAAGV